MKKCCGGSPSAASSSAAVALSLDELSQVLFFLRAADLRRASCCCRSWRLVSQPLFAAPRWQAHAVSLPTLLREEAVGEEAVVTCVREHGAEPADLADAHTRVRNLLRIRSFHAAATVGRKLVAARTHALGPSHADTLMTQRFLVSALTRIGAVHEADLLQQSMEDTRLAKIEGQQRPTVPLALMKKRVLLHLHTCKNKDCRACDWMRQCIEARRVKEGMLRDADDVATGAACRRLIVDASVPRGGSALPPRDTRGAANCRVTVPP